MSPNTVQKSDNLKHAMCYIPFVSIVLFFIEENKSDELKKHIKYSVVLIGAYILISSIFWFLTSILFLAYVGFSGYLGYKAYNGEKFNVEIIDKAEEKIKKEL